MKSNFLVITLVLIALLIVPLSPLALSDDDAHTQDEAIAPVDEPKQPVETPEESVADEPAALADPDTSDPDEPQDEPLAQGLVVFIDEAVLFPGQQAQALARISPTDADQAVEWSSSEPDTVMVDAQGVLIADSAVNPPEDGVYVDIWARATDGSLMMSCTTVHVLPPANRLKLLPGTLTVSAGDAARTAFIAVDMAPAALYGVLTIEWSSSDPSIATAAPAGDRGEVGVVTWGDKPGTATITARALDGSNISDVLLVTVTP